MTFPANYDEIFKMLNHPSKQLEEYDDVTPFEHNKTAWSPNLVNLLLTVSPHIESVTGILLNEFNLTAPPGSGIKGAIQTIDSQGVLSNLEINFRSKKTI